MRYWLNVDFPTKISKLHKSRCVHEQNKKETSLKGIGKLKRDGGWLYFETQEDAEKYWQENLKNRTRLEFCLRRISSHFAR